MYCHITVANFSPIPAHDCQRVTVHPSLFIVSVLPHPQGDSCSFSSQGTTIQVLEGLLRLHTLLSAVVTFPKPVNLSLCITKMFLFVFNFNIYAEGGERNLLVCSEFISCTIFFLGKPTILVHPDDLVNRYNESSAKSFFFFFFLKRSVPLQFFSRIF